MKIVHKFNITDDSQTSFGVEYYGDSFKKLDRRISGLGNDIQELGLSLSYNLAPAGTFSAWATKVKILGLAGGRKDPTGCLRADWVSQFLHLKSLNINPSVMVPEDAIMSLPFLEELYVSSQKMEDFYQVTAKPTLRYLMLYLQEMKPVDLTRFEPSVNLDHLVLTKRGLRLPNLEKFRSISKLKVALGVKSLEPLAVLHRLKELNLEGNPSIASFAPLAGLPIEKLTLTVKRVDSLKFLLDLPKLRDLEFFEKCIIDDEDVSPILEHPSLKRCQFNISRPYYTRLFAGKPVPPGLNLVY